MVEINSDDYHDYVIGYDISPTCYKEAQEIFHNMDFYVLNLMKCNKKDQYKKGQAKRLFTLRGTLWYVFPSMVNVVKNIANLSENGDYLLISQNFPPLESNFVGKDTIPNSESIIEWFKDYFIPLKTIWLEDMISKGNDNWFIGIFLRRKES